jgi:putative component of membrane protein insertase Oxa1/YidC/SpoIIIJ protein YidD
LFEVLKINFILFLLSLLGQNMFAQEQQNVKSYILKQYFQQPLNGEQPKRAFIQTQTKGKVIKSISGGLIYFYQNIVSEQIQADCSYEITCSEYIKLCIEYYGFLKGTMAGLNQYMKCSGNNHKNHLPYMVNEDDNINNSVFDEK